MLKFSPANAKIRHLSKIPAIAQYLTNKRKVYSLDLLSGYSCPFAEKCLSKAVIDPITNKRSVKDGPKTEFRCFSASQEVIFPAVYRLRKHNFDTLRQFKFGDMLATIGSSLPQNAGVIRIHVGGDFFNQDYFDAWLYTAIAHQDKLFYAYTKSLPYWLARRTELKAVRNFVLTASYGGRHDSLIKKHRLRYSKVVYSVDAAGDMPIDHDDSHAADPSLRSKPFALLIHGIQPKGTEASKALVKLKGVGSYNRKGPNNG